MWDENKIREMLQNLYLQKGNGGISLSFANVGTHFDIGGANLRTTSVIITTRVGRFQQPLPTASRANHTCSLEEGE